jgi:YggT family protein
MSVASILITLLRLYEIVLIVRVFISWIQPDPYHPLVQWIHRLTEPLLEPIRKILPNNSLGIDFAPLVAFVLLQLLSKALQRGLFIPW